jgi:hypothetical protein
MRQRFASLQTVLVWLTLVEFSLARRDGKASLGRTHPHERHRWAQQRQLFRLFGNRQEEGESGTTTTIVSHPLPSPSFPTASPQPSISTTLTNTTASPPFKTADRTYTTTVNVDAASGIDVYTSYCPENDIPSVSNVTISNTSISNTTRTPIVVTHVIAFQYQLTIQPDGTMVEVVHDLERRLQTFLALWYLNCTTTFSSEAAAANTFAVTTLQSLPIDTVGAPCASGVARCRVIHGRITASLYYPINDPLSRRQERVLLLLRQHSNKPHQRLRQIQQVPIDNSTSDGDAGEAVATIMTDFIVAESFGSALSLFFENNRTDHNRSLIANLEYLAITNFASSDQPTYGAVDKISGDRDPTGASSLKGTDLSSPADNGSVQYSWGAAVLGMAILGLLATTCLAWRRHRRQSHGPNKASATAATLAPEDSPTVSLRQRPSSGRDQRASLAARDRLSGDTSRTKQGSMRARTQKLPTEPPIPFSAASHDESVSEKIDLDSTRDYTKKHAFVLGDDYWDDDDYDSLSDAEQQSNSIEVHYHDRSSSAVAAAEVPASPPPRPPIALRAKNSNPPQFVSTSFDDDSNVSAPSSPGQRRYDPYGPQDYSTPDTMDL